MENITVFRKYGPYTWEQRYKYFSHKNSGSFLQTNPDNDSRKSFEIISIKK